MSQAIDVRKDTQVPAEQPQPSNIMQAIIRAASDPATDIAKVESMMALYERLEAKRAESAFNEAMSAAQTDMRPVTADKDNSQTKSRYASYGALDKAVRPIYTSHGFSLSFDTGESPVAEQVRILCYAAHRDGHSRTYHIDMPADGKGAKGGDVMTKTHAVGAALSYGSRYLLKLIFNVAVGEDDDDGNGASGGRITEEQAERILELLTKDKADVKRFCAYMKVPSIVELPAKEYTRAIEVINTRSQKVKEAP